MIFDNIEDFGQLDRSAPSLHQPVYKTSLDSFFEDKKKEIAKGNFLDLYDVYQLKPNEAFISNLKQTKENRQYQKENCVRKHSIDLYLNKKEQEQVDERNSTVLLTREEQTKELLLADSRTNFDSDTLSIEEYEGGIQEQQPKNSFYCKNQISIQDNLEIDNVADFDKKKPTKAKSLNNNLKVQRRDRRQLKSFDFVTNPVDNKEDMLNSFVSLDGMVKEEERIKAEEEVCRVCFKDFKLNDFIVRLRRCGHIFHRDCMNDLIQKQDKEGLTCLVCQEELN